MRNQMVDTIPSTKNVMVTGTDQLSSLSFHDLNRFGISRVILIFIFQVYFIGLNSTI